MKNRCSPFKLTRLQNCNAFLVSTSSLEMTPIVANVSMPFSFCWFKVVWIACQINQHFFTSLS